MTANGELRFDLLKAITECPHVIEDGRVTLLFDGNQAGHNALNQLLRRLEASMLQPAVPAGMTNREAFEDAWRRRGLGVGAGKKAAWHMWQEAVRSCQPAMPADAEDAARYRWMRRFGIHGLPQAQSILQCQMVEGGEGAMDAAIDARRRIEGDGGDRD